MRASNPEMLARTRPARACGAGGPKKLAGKIAVAERPRRLRAAGGCAGSRPPLGREAPIELRRA
jgi:hypothetical protein